MKFAVMYYTKFSHSVSFYIHAYTSPTSHMHLKHRCHHRHTSEAVQGSARNVSASNKDTSYHMSRWMGILSVSMRGALRMLTCGITTEALPVSGWLGLPSQTLRIFRNGSVYNARTTTVLADTGMFCASSRAEQPRIDTFHTYVKSWHWKKQYLDTMLFRRAQSSEIG